MNARTLTEAEVMDRQIAQLRVPPHSIEAESSLLGGLLLDNFAWDRVGDILTESDFYRHEHRLIFGVIAALINASRPADVITVYERLQTMGKDHDGVDMAYLHGLSQYVPSAGNMRRYAEIVRERAILRKLVAASDEIATKAFNPEGASIEQLLDEAQGKIQALSESRRAGNLDEWAELSDGIVAVLDRIQDVTSDPAAARDFIPTGLRDLDERLDGGMRPGDFIVIGARSGMGKSALAKTIGLNVAMNEGLPVGEFSMEMAKGKQHNRMVSGISGVHLSKINRPERLNDRDWPRITQAVEVLRQLQYDINDQGGLTIDQIRTRARALKRKRGRLGLLIVDHLQLIRGTDPRAPRTYQLAEGSRGLKSLAKELGCPVIGLAQINRSVDKEVDPMPRNSDLADSGSIEQDADVIVLFDRPYKRKPDLGEEWKHYTKAHVSKVRDGEPGYISLKFIGENTYFMDWPEDEPIPQSQVVTRKKGAEL
jgi:replicative DNA helicase